MMPKQVTLWEDSKGKHWLTEDEAKAAEEGYALDEQIAEAKVDFRAELFRGTPLNSSDCADAIDYLFQNYDMMQLKKLS